MKRIWGHTVVIVSLAVGLASFAPACTTNDQSIYIRDELAPSTSRINGRCVYTADPTQPVNFHPSLDVGITDSYFAVLLIGNQMLSRSDPTNARTDSDKIHINGGVVRITNPDGSDVVDAAGNSLGNFTSVATGFAESANGATPSYSVIELKVVDAPTAAAIKATLPNRQVTRTILANIKVFGKTVGNEDLESGEFQMPIEVCNGCLVLPSTDPAAVTPDKPVNCGKPLDATALTTATFGVPCVLGQNEATSCQLCLGRPACDDPSTP